MFQDTLQLLISIILLADIFASTLLLLQSFWISLGTFLAILLVLPLSLLFPFAAGLSAFFSKGPRRASLTRVYALWNVTSLSNIVSLPSTLTESSSTWMLYNILTHVNLKPFDSLIFLSYILIWKLNLLQEK